MLEKVKTALRITTDDFDDELEDMIAAAYLDMGIAGVVIPDEIDALVGVAVKTYCKLNFSQPSPDDYDRLKKAYNEQKAQLSMATEYTDYGDSVSEE